MSLLFKNKNLKVLLLEPMASRRAQFSEALREFGIKNITGAASIEDGLALLNAEDKPYDWIFTPLSSGKTASGFHFLSLVLTEKKYRDTKVSFFLKDDEHYVLNHAFEMGLLSFHRRDLTAKDFASDLETFFQTAQIYNWQIPLVSAHYLRSFLKFRNELPDAMDLAKALVLNYPDQPYLLMHLGESQLLSGKFQEAMTAFGRARSLDESLSPQIERIIENNTRASEAGASAADQAIAVAVLVDSDAAIRHLLHDALLTMGAAKIVSFQDGQEAWEWLDTNDEPSLIIQEWRLPKVSGNVLVQRIRTKGLSRVPIIIYSSLVKANDNLLLKEMGVTEVIEKPLSKKLLTATLKSCLEKELFPSDPDGMVTRIRKFLEAKKVPEAKKIFDLLKKNKTVKQAVISTVEAEMAYAEGRFAHAKKVGFSSLQEHGDSIFLLNVLAKVHIKLGEHEIALKFLEKANSVNPQNIARLCALAELNGIQGNATSAETALESAKAIDRENLVVKETEAKVALSLGKTDTAKELLKELPSENGLVAYLNNSAVVLASKGEMNEAIKLYERGLAALGNKRDRVSSTVHYNMSLALAKDGQLKPAEDHLKIAAESGDGPLLAKAQSLLKRVQTSLKTGTALELNVGKTIAEEIIEDVDVAPESSLAIPVIPDLKPGDLCLYKIYVSKSHKDERINKLLSKMPRMAAR